MCVVCVRISSGIDYSMWLNFREHWTTRWFKWKELFNVYCKLRAEDTTEVGVHIFFSFTTFRRVSM